MSMKINTQMLDLHALLDEHENVFVTLNHVYILTLHSMKEMRIEKQSHMTFYYYQERQPMPLRTNKSDEHMFGFGNETRVWKQLVMDQNWWQVVPRQVFTSFCLVLI